MKKEAFFIEAMKAKLYKKRGWVTAAFAITISSEQRVKDKKPYPYKIFRTPSSVGFLNPNNLQESIYIEDANPNEPLFKFTDRIKADSSFCQNILEPVDTTYGNVLVNLITLVNAFGNKIPFVVGKFNVSAIEDIIASKLESNPENEAEKKHDRIYVDEYTKFVNSLNSYLASLSTLCVVAATPKNIIAPPGIEEYKKELLKEYGDKLNNPVYMSEFEKKLIAYDDDFLKDDPSRGKFLSGKERDLSRTKLHLTFGGVKGFENNNDVIPVINSLDEGWEKSTEQYKVMMDNVRYGSFARGTETQQGGVISKVLMRVASNYEIIDTDCGTKVGLFRYINKLTFKNLIGRQIMINGSWITIHDEEEAVKYISTNQLIRSPMFCKVEKDKICKLCAGRKLAINSRSISSALIEISAAILKTSLKKMHGKVLQTTELNIERVFS